MATLYKHALLRYTIALVWMTNGLGCKVLGLVPRHEVIVGRILGSSYATEITMMIGLGELFIGGWVLSRYRPKLAAIVQIVLVLTMNVIELIVVPGLLLWGRLNMVFALLFVGIVYIHGIGCSSCHHDSLMR